VFELIIFVFITVRFSAALCIFFISLRYSVTTAHISVRVCHLKLNFLISRDTKVPMSIL